MGKLNRILFGGVIGMLAGFSFQLAVLPFMAENFFPEAMADVMEKELPGFGEEMRRASLREVPTAILSRQTAGTRGKTLIVNLPGKPGSIDICLTAVFPAIPFCLDLIGAGRIETRDEVLKAFRPSK